MKKNRKLPVRKWSAGRGALLAIAVMFCASGIVRLGAGTGEAIAKEVASFNADPEGHATPQQCQTEDGVAEVLAELMQREAKILSRENELAVLQHSVVLAKEQIQLNLVELQRAEEKLGATISLAEGAAEDDLTRLTSVYENMKPKDAAVLFGEMSPDFAAGFIARMRTDAAAQILAGISPEMAYSISAILAGRNANVPTE